VCECLAQEAAVIETVRGDGVDSSAASDGLVDKSRPLFRVGDDDTSDSQLIAAAAAAAGVVGQETSKADTQASLAVNDTTADVKLSTPKCQPLDTAANVTTPLMHKSASK